jgi:hypothetical protein
MLSSSSKYMGYKHLMKMTDPCRESVSHIFGAN